jgi:hypothetical protein
MWSRFQLKYITGALDNQMTSNLSADTRDLIVMSQIIIS